MEALKALLPPILQAIGLIVATVWAVRQYRQTSRSDRQKPIREAQLQLILRVTAACAQIATTDDAEVYLAAKRSFWELYHGPLILIEDRALEAAMVQFGHDLAEAQFDSARDALKIESMRLAKAARALIERSWKIDLGQLRDIRGKA